MTKARAYDKALAETMEDDRTPNWEPLEEEFGKLAGLRRCKGCKFIP